jgi:chemotaxis family two-component system sensor kinase Cph1
MADPGISTPSVDVTNCDLEPIHIPGAILPHGAMLVLDAATLEVLQAAGDTSRLLGVPLEELLGQSAEVLFRADQIENLRGLVAALDLKKPRHLLDPQLRVITGQPLDASLHRIGGSLVLEFEAADPSDRFAADPLAGVQEMVGGFGESPSLLALRPRAGLSVHA